MHFWGKLYKMNLLLNTTYGIYGFALLPMKKTQKCIFTYRPEEFAHLSIFNMFYTQIYLQLLLNENKCKVTFSNTNLSLLRLWQTG